MLLFQKTKRKLGKYSSFKPACIIYTYKKKIKKNTLEAAEIQYG